MVRMARSVNHFPYLVYGRNNDTLTLHKDRPFIVGSRSQCSTVIQDRVDVGSHWFSCVQLDVMNAMLASSYDNMSIITDPRYKEVFECFVTESIKANTHRIIKGDWDEILNSVSVSSTKEVHIEEFKNGSLYLPFDTKGTLILSTTFNEPHCTNGVIEFLYNKACKPVNITTFTY